MDSELHCERTLSTKGDFDYVFSYLQKYQQITSLKITNAEMTSLQVRTICDNHTIRKNLRTLQNLNLSNNHLTNEGIEILLKRVLRKCSTLVHLNLSGNKFLESNNALMSHTPLPGFKRILSCPKSWPHLTHLALSHIDFKQISRIVTASTSLQSLTVYNMSPTKHKAKTNRVSQNLASMVSAALHTVGIHNVLGALPSTESYVMKRSFYSLCDVLQKKNTVLRDLWITSELSFWELARGDIPFQADMVSDDSGWDDVVEWVDYLIQSLEGGRAIASFHMTGITDYDDTHSSGSQKVAARCAKVRSIVSRETPEGF
ncbi:hypothetical protein BGX28_000856 [Mortierella sp. GBA30]|nr:hypothetical protein BGX28_000856 [Mortierella sp. GBA30]